MNATKKAHVRAGACRQIYAHTCVFKPTSKVFFFHLPYGKNFECGHSSTWILVQQKFLSFSLRVIATPIVG